MNDQTAPPRHTITQQWLDASRGPTGLHSPRQLALLGIVDPPPPNWYAIVIGEQIADDVRGRFERLASERR